MTLESGFDSEPDTMATSLSTMEEVTLSETAALPPSQAKAAEFSRILRADVSSPTSKSGWLTLLSSKDSSSLSSSKTSSSVYSAALPNPSSSAQEMKFVVSRISGSFTFSLSFPTEGKVSSSHETPSFPRPVFSVPSLSSHMFKRDPSLLSTAVATSKGSSRRAVGESAESQNAAYVVLAIAFSLTGE